MTMYAQMNFMNTCLYIQTKGLSEIQTQTVQRPKQEHVLYLNYNAV